MSERKAKAIVTLYTRSGCQLCEEAKDRVLRVIREFQAELREVDIDADAELRARFDKEVPVIFVGDSLFARYQVDPVEFRATLSKIAKSNGKEVKK